MELKFCPTTIFRETPKVTFFDAGLDSTNGCDVVIHSGEAISPPDEFEHEQYYVHNHQIDHTLVITGERKFILINPTWDEPHHVIYLKRSWLRQEYANFRKKFKKKLHRLSIWGRLFSLLQLNKNK